MKKRSFFSQLALVAMTVSTILLSACAGGGKKMEIKEFAGDWRIVEVNGKAVEGEMPPILTFDLDKMTFFGNNTCNQIQGSLVFDQEKEGGLVLGNVLSTLMSCANSPMETEIMQAIDGVAAYGELEEGGIVPLYNKNNELLLKLKKWEVIEE